MQLPHFDAICCTTEFPIVQERLRKHWRQTTLPYTYVAALKTHFCTQHILHHIFICWICDAIAEMCRIVWPAMKVCAHPLWREENLAASHSKNCEQLRPRVTRCVRRGMNTHLDEKAKQCEWLVCIHRRYSQLAIDAVLHSEVRVQWMCVTPKRNVHDCRRRHRLLHFQDGRDSLKVYAQHKAEL